MRPLSIAISFFLIFFSFMVSAQTFGPTQNPQGKRMAKQQRLASLDAKEIDLFNAQVTALQAQLTEAENTNQQLTMAYQNAIAMLESSKKDFQSMSQSAQSMGSLFREQLTQYRHQLRSLSPAHLSGIMRQFRDNAFSLTSFKPNMTITPVGGVIETKHGDAEMQGTTHPFTLMTVVALIILVMIFLSMLSCQQKKIAVATALKQEVKAEENEEDKDYEDYPEVTSDELDSESFARSVKNYQYLSGENVETSKLDLSKAYIEMGSYTHARRVLESVIQAGNESQQAEAKKLLHMIENKS